MPSPIISITFTNMRERVARRLDDHIEGTASGGSATTLTDTGDIDRLPADYLLGAEISTIAGTGLGQSRNATDHTKTGGTVTLTVPTWTAVGSDTTYEIHKIGGRGFSKAQYDDSINAAIDSMGRAYFTDTDNIYFAVESSTPPSGIKRHEYPMPTGFLYLYGVDKLGIGPSTGLELFNMDTRRAMGDATARTRIWQGFQVGLDGWYEWVCLYIDKVGSPTGNLTVQIHTDSAGIPSGTTVTDGTSDTFDGATVDARGRFIPFRLDPPVFLVGGTQYHIVLVRSDAVSASAYWRWAEDDDNGYGLGTAGTYDATTYTAVSGSDFIFHVFPASTEWTPISRSNWEYRRVGADFIAIKVLPNEGTPIRLRGGAAIAEPTAETTTLAVEPDYVEAFALDWLLSGRAGMVYPDNYATAAREWARHRLERPRPSRPIPANAIRVYT